ncbi:tetraspanin-9-like [Dendronephthya gigantea]|uniref:tetraspanin-9-like n=1 Tax=Dendronephthya gigantea TaxID=151771 RepID=UPI00106A9C48|nr:tetraspanin-9-like [Dendronephthya gigantea]XP_028409455.1 tetraspanin-9-like [Dendronephthya gigantea]
MGESCYGGVRVIVIFFNFIFFLSGCGILSFGIYVQIEKGDYAAVSTTRGLTASLLLIIAGFITAVISFLGCLGAYKKIRTLLWIFVVMMALIVILEIAALVLAIVYRGKLKDELREDMTASLEEYGLEDQDGITDGWNWIQRKFECCGVNDSLDWARHPNKVNKNGSHNVVPDSCCVVEKKDCGDPYKYSNQTIINAIYTKGCFNELRDFLENNLLVIGVLAAVFVVIELVAMVLAFLLLSYFKENGQFV